MENDSKYYVRKVYRELYQWEKEVLKADGMLFKTSKRMSTKINEMLPKRVHDVITSTVKNMVKTVLSTARFIPKTEVRTEGALHHRDQQAETVLNKYQKIAVAEGAATGAGGILMGLADFPAFLAIKMNFLFELAHIYGYDTKKYSERLFILYIFQLAFSSSDVRRQTYKIIKHWNEKIYDLDGPSLSEPKWQTFQQEYRDSIDFRKMLQMLPGIGAVVGAWANNSLTKTLGKTAINCYRLRYLNDHPSNM